MVNLFELIKQYNDAAVKGLRDEIVNAADVVNDFDPGNTPLHAAIFLNASQNNAQQRLAIINHLIQVIGDQWYSLSGAVHPFAKQNKAGLTPLMAAVTCGDLGAVNLLLQYQSSCDIALQAEDAQQNTALHLACQIEDAQLRQDIITVLVQAGADKRAVNKAGQTPLALLAEQTADLDALRDFDPDAPAKVVTTTVPDPDSFFGYGMKEQTQHKTVAQRFQETDFFQLVRCGSLKQLREKKPKDLQSQKTLDGCNLLHYAVMYAPEAVRDDMLQFLADAGVSILDKNKYGHSAHFMFQQRFIGKDFPMNRQSASVSAAMPQASPQRSTMTRPGATPMPSPERRAKYQKNQAAFAEIDALLARDNAHVSDELRAALARLRQNPDVISGSNKAAILNGIAAHNQRQAIIAQLISISGDFGVDGMMVPDVEAPLPLLVVSASRSAAAGSQSECPFETLQKQITSLGKSSLKQHYQNIQSALALIIDEVKVLGVNETDCAKSPLGDIAKATSALIKSLHPSNGQVCADKPAAIATFSKTVNASLLKLQAQTYALYAQEGTGLYARFYQFCHAIVNALRGITQAAQPSDNTASLSNNVPIGIFNSWELGNCRRGIEQAADEYQPQLAAAP